MKKFGLALLSVTCVAGLLAVTTTSCLRASRVQRNRAEARQADAEADKAKAQTEKTKAETEQLKKESAK